ncbi:MAG: TolC family protein [Lysobacterales bacterium]
MPFLLLLLMLILISAAPVAAADEAATEILPGASVESIHQWLRRHNPSLSALALDTEAAEERVDLAAAWPDPRFAVELRDIDIDRPRLLPGQTGSTRYLLRQSLPLWGKRELAREQARAEADATASARDATELELLASADRAYVRYWQTEQSLRVLEHILGRLDDLRALAESRYAAGLAQQQDALQAAVELTRMRGEQIRRRAEGQAAAAALNAALGRSPLAPLAPPEGRPQLPVDQRLEALLAQAPAAHPRVQMEQELAAAAEREQELTRRQRYPDLNLGLGLIQAGSQLRAFELMFEIELPLQRTALHQRERIAALRSEAALTRREAALNQIRGELASAHARWFGARAQRQLIEDTLLLEAETAYVSSLASYGNSAVDFGTLLQALRQNLAAELDHVDALEAELLAAADVRALTGDAQ